MQFDAHTDSGHQVVVDAGPRNGGQNLGPRPTELLLGALGACTGMDAVSVLQKMRAGLTSFDVELDGEQRTDHPHAFEHIRISFTVTGGPGCTDAKVSRALQLSRDKYCSVAHSLKAPIVYRYRINGGEWTEVGEAAPEAAE